MLFKYIQIYHFLLKAGVVLHCPSLANDHVNNSISNHLNLYSFYERFSVGLRRKKNTENKET